MGSNKIENPSSPYPRAIFTKVGVFLVLHNPHKFEMDLGCLAPASEVTESRTYYFRKGMVCQF
jgi:hypothetical protein